MRRIVYIYRMAITDRTRKDLWARSGNRCALCHTELSLKQELSQSDLNIGEECHIISEKLAGPRHSPNFPDYDACDNLVLLCRNHHRMIDEDSIFFSVELIRKIKSNHELWVKSCLETADKKLDPKVRFYPRITSGKRLVEIVDSVHAHHFDHDELNTSEEAEQVSEFIQNMSDWVDVLGMDVVERSERIKLGFQLNEELQKLEKVGFILFGDREKIWITGPDKKKSLWDAAIILVLRQNNKSIIDSKIVAASLQLIGLQD
jgi:hypothetical protein